jgi:hypothetical protein
VLLIAGEFSRSTTTPSSRQVALPAALVRTYQVRTVHTPKFPSTATELKVIFGHAHLTVTSTPSPLFTPYVLHPPATTEATPPATVVAAAPASDPTPAPTAPVPAASVAAPTPVTAVTSTVSGLPPLGHATVPGCAAALVYLTAYAAPGFHLECPVSAQGHEATTTCISEHSLCDLGRYIEIADPCPAAYMNEASNSWVLLGLSSAPIDPYGYCG